MLHNLTVAVLNANVRLSGEVLLPDGTPLNASFLDGSSASGSASQTTNSSMGPSESVSAASNVWKRKIEEACSEFQAYMSSAGSTTSVAGSAQEERSLHDNISLMQTLMMQYHKHCVFMSSQQFKEMDAE